MHWAEGHDISDRISGSEENESSGQPELEPNTLGSGCGLQGPLQVQQVLKLRDESSESRARSRAAGPKWLVSMPCGQRLFLWAGCFVCLWLPSVFNKLPVHSHSEI